jgi:hypothetical protein
MMALQNMEQQSIHHVSKTITQKDIITNSKYNPFIGLAVA